MIYDKDIREKAVLTVPNEKARATFLGGCTPENRAEFGNPVEFTKELAWELYHQVRRAHYANYPTNFTFKLGSHEINSEAYRFMLALKAYYESINPLLDPETLFSIILEGSDGITLLKKLRSYHLVSSRGGRFYEDDPELERIKHMSSKMGKLEDIGQIFNVRYWFFWSQPDEEDWQYCFKPLNKIKQADLDRLEQVTFDMLQDDISPIYEEEILLSVSGSSARKKDGKPSKVFLEKQTSNRFSTEPLEGYGTFIQKCPGDTRFSITLSVPQSNTVKLIEKQIAKIAEECPFSAYVTDDSEFAERFNKFKTSNKTFFCRDLKKDGLTKSRPLLQAVLRAIKRKYPTLPCNKYFSIYDDFFIHINGERHNPPRGIGLGMSSALTTILQAALVIITRQDMLEELEVFGNIDAIIYHDDISIGSEDEATLEEYCAAEDLVMARYGQILNKRKSFFADWFVLCETYSDEILDRKDSYQRYLIQLPYAAVNVAHAKFIFASNLRYIHTTDWKQYLEELVTFWGYEYFPDELRSPYQLGGWVPAYYMSVDIALTLRNQPSRFEKCAALSYTMERPYMKKRLSKYSTDIYNSPVKQLFGQDISVGDEKKSYLVGLTERDVARMYQKLTGYGEKSAFWHNVYKKRVQAFNKQMLEPDLELQHWYNEYQKVWPTTDIIPPRELLVLDDIEQFESGSIYQPSNPWMQYLKFHNPELLSDKIIPWPVPPGPNRASIKLQLTSEERRQAAYATTLLQSYDFGEIALVMVRPKVILSKSYFNTNSVRSACMSLYGRDCLPRNNVRSTLEYVNNMDMRLVDKPAGITTKFIEVLTSRIGWKVVNQLAGNMTDFQSAVMPFINRRKALEEQAKAYLIAEKEMVTEGNEESSGNNSMYQSTHQTYSSTPLADGEYFNWEHSHRMYKDWRNAYFRRIHDKTGMMKLEKLDGLSVRQIADQDWGVEFHLTEVEAYFWERAGGTFLPGGTVPNLWRGALSELDSNSEKDFEEQVQNPGSDPGSDVSIGGMFD